MFLQVKFLSKKTRKCCTADLLYPSAHLSELAQFKEKHKLCWLLIEFTHKVKKQHTKTQKKPRHKHKKKQDTTHRKEAKRTNTTRSNLNFARKVGRCSGVSRRSSYFSWGLDTGQGTGERTTEGWLQNKITGFYPNIGGFPNSQNSKHSPKTPLNHIKLPKYNGKNSGNSQERVGGPAIWEIFPNDTIFFL